MERDAAWMYAGAGLVREPGLERRVGGGSMGFGSWTGPPVIVCLGLAGLEDAALPPGPPDNMGEADRSNQQSLSVCLTN